MLPALLSGWGERAGGALINTSFNGCGEPIRLEGRRRGAGAFRRLGLDFLVLDGELLAHEPGWWRST